MNIQVNSGLFDLRTLLFLTVVFALLSIAILSGNGYHSFNWILDLTSEDRWLETLQALGYLAGFVVCLIGVVASGKRLFFLIWAVLTLFFLGEEISWGQRIFDYEVESVQRHSLQNEFNIHNLEFFNTGGLTSAQSWTGLLKALLDIQFIFQFCLLMYFAVLPVVISFSGPLRRLALKLQYISPSWQIVLLFLVPLLATYLSNLMVGDEVHKDAIVEIRETVFGIIVPLYLYQTLRAYR